MDRHARTICKTITWRILATSTTLLLVYFFTGNLTISAGVSISEILLKTAFYYLHERAWNKTNLGQNIPLISEDRDTNVFMEQSFK